MSCIFIVSVIGCAAVTVTRKVIDVNPITSYQKVVDLPSMSKNIIQNKAHLWFIENIRNAKESVQLNDTLNGEVIGNVFQTYVLEHDGTMQIPSDMGCFSDPTIKTKCEADYQIKFLIKEGKYKYFITLRNIKQSNPFPSRCGRGDPLIANNPQTIRIIQEDIDATNSIYIKNISNEIQKYMSSIQTDDQW